MIFVYEDGKGNAIDDAGHHVLDMEIDEESYPLDAITDYDTYMVHKPPERKQAAQKICTPPVKDQRPTEMKRGPYKQHSNSDKEKMFFLIYKKGMTTGKAAAQLQIPRRTAYNWVKRDQEDPSDEVQPKKTKGSRKAILTEIHEQHIISFVDDNPSAPLDDMMASLTQQFEGLSVSKTTV
ncbi:hypothetical protein K492DRAFT_115921, partial [Lichtheimia hyalospora FSU 10163]